MICVPIHCFELHISCVLILFRVWVRVNFPHAVSFPMRSFFLISVLEVTTSCF